MGFQTRVRARGADLRTPRQRTLATAAGTRGVALHAGVETVLTLRPAPADHGIRFLRRDVPGSRPIPALWDRVVGLDHCTTIGFDDGPRVATIEHLMAALAGLGVDNCLVEIDGPEVPALDGSAAGFVALIDQAGIVEQSAPRHALRVLRPVEVSAGGKWARIAPGPALSLGFLIDFPARAIGRQSTTIRVTEASFRREVAGARTFGQRHEVEHLRAHGLARGGSLDNAVVVDGDAVLNPEGLRWADEFVRHKILDAIGDLALVGMPVLGHVQCERGGHALTNQLLAALFADRSAWIVVDHPPAVARVEGGAAPSFDRLAAGPA